MDHALTADDDDAHQDTGKHKGVAPSDTIRRTVGDLENNEPQITSSPYRRSAGSIRFVRIMFQEDVVRSLPIAREFHEESRYRRIPFSEEKFLRVYGAIVARPDRTFGVLVERHEQVIGVVLAEVGQYFLGDGGTIATNHVLYVTRRFRQTTLGGRITVRLMRLFIDWAKSKGASEIQVQATSGIEPERTDRFLKQLKFVPYGGNYSIRV